MSFASPIWLLGLLPWAGLVLWLLRGHRDRAEVPFLKLWTRTTPPPRTRRSLHIPPQALVWLLVGILLALIGAGGPLLRDPTRGPKITIIVDRDVTMSAQVDQSDRLTILREQMIVPIDAAFGFGPVDLIVVPDQSVRRTERSDWIDAARDVQPSSLRTGDVLRSTVNDVLRRERSPIILLSDQAIGLNEDRLVQIASQTKIQNTGIVRVAAREHPSPQVMVVLRNQSPQTRAELVVASDGQSQRRSIELPPQQGEATFFIDLPKLGRVVSVDLIVEDDLMADNRAWLVRQRSWPIIETRTAVSEELSRMIDVYREHRPSADGSIRVIVASEGNGDEPTAIVAAVAGSEPVGTAAPLKVEDHPVAALVDWNLVASDARVARAPAGEWTPLVSVGDQVLVAIREQPRRQVWVGITSDSWPRRSDFVIFWTNVFDWLGEGGGERFLAESMKEPGSEWKRSEELSGSVPLPLDPPPGVWVRADGAMRALNAIDIPVSALPNSDWQRRLQSIPAASAGWRPLAGATFVAALGCALLAVLFWGAPARKSSST